MTVKNIHINTPPPTPPPPEHHNCHHHTTTTTAVTTNTILYVWDCIFFLVCPMSGWNIISNILVLTGVAAWGSGKTRLAGMVRPIAAPRVDTNPTSSSILCRWASSTSPILFTHQFLFALPYSPSWKPWKRNVQSNGDSENLIDSTAKTRQCNTTDLLITTQKTINSCKEILRIYSIVWLLFHQKQK